jgi:ElaB/YqjD/DUF883 family membrane-anchored ribosome-binding protein
MDDQPEVIRQQMEVTRTDLTRKIEALEQQVIGTVQDTTQAVTETVESVKEAVQETVETVKDTVSGTVGAVKESVSDTVDAVKDALDVPAYVKEYPWASFGAAVATGYVGGLLTRHRPADRMRELHSRGEVSFFEDNEGYDGPSGPQEDYTRVAHRAVSTAGPTPSRPSWFHQLAERFAPELDKVKGLALGAAGALVRDLVAPSFEGQLGERVSEVIDDFTRKLGGEPMRGSFLPTTGVGGKSSRERDAACEMRRDRAGHAA